MVNNGTGALGIPAEEADSYCVLAGRADAGLIVLCDHADNALPPRYGTLGLPREQLGRHIAYDIGAAPITRALADRAWRAGRADALLEVVDRSQPRSRRSDLDYAAVRRGGGTGQSPPRRRRTSQPHRSLLSSLPPGNRARHRSVPGFWRNTGAAFHPLLYGELEGRPRVPGMLASCGTQMPAWPSLCSTASMPKATSSSAIMNLIRGNSKATVCGSTARGAASPMP